MDEYDKSTKIKHGCWTPNIFLKQIWKQMGIFTKEIGKRIKITDQLQL